VVRLCTSSHKYDHGPSQLLHDELHWLDVPGRVQYKLAVTVLQYPQNWTLKYLVDRCVPDSDVATRRHLRHHVTVLRYRRSTFCRQAFSVGADDLERTARRSPRPVAHCRWLPAIVKDSFVCQILVYSARLRCHMKSQYKFTIDTDSQTFLKIGNVKIMQKVIV